MPDTGPSWEIVISPTASSEYFPHSDFIVPPPYFEKSQNAMGLSLLLQSSLEMHAVRKKHNSKAFVYPYMAGISIFAGI